MTRPRIAVLADYREEGWPSMDLVAEALADALARGDAFAPELVRPAFRRSFTRLPLLGGRRSAWNGERLLNRFVHYPRRARALRATFDAFHVSDHSYAHLVHALPPERTGVFCHDLDAFRSLLEPEREPRPAWFRALARRTLAGLAKAAVVFHSTRAIGAALRALVREEVLVHAPYGVSPEFLRDPAPAGGRYLLHVGSSAPRKRLDLVIAAFEAAGPDVTLVQVGGTWSEAERARLAPIAGRVEQLRGVSRERLAALYAGAALVILPSDAEGFGLPIVEALACGAPVLASDLATTREVGGAAALYERRGDVDAWRTRVRALLCGEESPPPRDARIAHGRAFTWDEHGRRVSAAYARVLGRGS